MSSDTTKKDELLGIQEALEYYAHPDHYEPTEKMGGTRPPGVLVEQGDFARKALLALHALRSAHEKLEEKIGEVEKFKTGVQKYHNLYRSKQEQVIRFIERNRELESQLQAYRDRFPGTNTFHVNNHIIGKAYALNQATMNSMIETIEAYQDVVDAAEKYLRTLDVRDRWALLSTVGKLPKQ